MKQLLQNMSEGTISLLECPAPQLSNNSIKICTKVSLISSGTERMLVGFGKASYIGKIRQQPEKVKMVVDKIATDGITPTLQAVRSKLAKPMPLGYSNVGVVEEVSAGITEFKVGDRVVSNGPHSDVVVVKKNLCARIPDNVDDSSAAFTVVGSIALQGVRLANPSLGETFVVFGVGLIGLLTVQLLRANGCRVLAIDIDNQKLKLASQLGAEICNASSGEDVLAAGLTMSRGRGVDGVIITAASKSNDLIKTAAQMCRKRGRIILVGVVGLNLNRADFYEKEISFQVSCSYGPGRYEPSYEQDGQDYPIGFVRWTEQRNFEAFLDMLSMGTVDVKPLISNRFNFNQANLAYAELVEKNTSLGILLDYNSKFSERLLQSVRLKKEFYFSSESPVVGFIGAGNYASRILIPIFKNLGAQMHTIVSENGINSAIHGTRSGFVNASSDRTVILNEKLINTVVVATQHDSHAELVVQALGAGKNVWVEKPLAINLKEIDIIETAFKNAHDTFSRSGKGPQLMVGFNRRFAPHIKKMCSLLSTLKTAKTVIITVNAGFVDEKHWTQDTVVGGGRIIGECCHFIDLMRFLVGYKITSICGHAMSSSFQAKKMLDKSSITLGFEDGSFGTILYLANGAPNFPKERIEVFSDGTILQLDNFKKLRGFGWRNFNKMNLFSQDKGQNAAVHEFINALKTGTSAIPPDQIFEVARATIQANEILLQN
ncbi:MAG: dehydrogenase [Legionellales bacterium]|nr:dehydrogenase [Legionellales bacterium]OUX66218.1 MAG: dehydrogenase [Gammaproteobacteria bacterium TMED281]